MPSIERLILYPIKSLDGIAVSQATVSPNGALLHDREFALLDEAGNFINGKRNARIHALRSSFDLENFTVFLRRDDESQVRNFHLLDETEQLAAWFSDYFGFVVKLVRNTDGGFPDDTDSPGPTIVSTASLQAVSSWFPALTPDEALQRFRSNIVISNVPAFWEDQLFGAPETTVDFTIGEVQFSGINPCARCVVPSRQPVTGAALPGFQRTFADRRKASLPDWAEHSRFDHFYRLAVNTRIPAAEAGKTIHLGNELKLKTYAT
jgi:uncharacterized protein